jgi:two-component system sensor histidine kinase DesK
VTTDPSVRDRATGSTTVGPVADPRAPATPDRPGRPVAGPPGRDGWAWAVVWLVYLLPVVQAALDLTDPLRRAASLLVVAAFVAAYLTVFVRTRRARWITDRTPPVRQRVLAMGVTTGLSVVALALIGQQANNILVYLAITAILVLDTRAGWAFVLAVVAAVEVSSRVVAGWEPDDGSLGFSVFLGAAALWGITQMINRNRELARAHERIAAMAVTEERTRFARDLHDLLGHSLTVITVKAELAGRLMPIDPARAEQEVHDVERLARDALADVRAAVAGYREVSLAGELVSARTALTAAGITAQLPTAVDDVPGERRELFGWAVREGVTNVVRHSGAAVCRIIVDRDGVRIEDDGRGPAGGSSGTGLDGLRERAAQQGATVSMGSGPDGGFRLRVGW